MTKLPEQISSIERDAQWAAERDRLAARLAEVERERDEQTAICTEAIAQVNALKAEVADLRKQLATAEEVADVYSELNACFRLGRNPSDKLFKRLDAIRGWEKARAAKSKEQGR